MKRENYGDQERHVEIRKKITDKKISIREDPQLNRIIDESGAGISEISDNSMSHLIYQLINHIQDVKVRTRALTKSTILKNYEERMQVPVFATDNASTRLSKYGGEIDFAVFSHIFKKNIWVLRPAANNEVFRWHLVNADRKRTYKEIQCMIHILQICCTSQTVQRICAAITMSLRVT